MPRYSFYQDTKVETWERSHFDVTANSCEEAVAIVKAFKDSDVDNHQDEEYIEFGTFESIYETSQKIEPLPGASPTIMIFDEDTGMPVVDNRKPPAETTTLTVRNMPFPKTAISKPIYGVCETEYSPLSKTSFCNPDSPESS